MKKYLLMAGALFSTLGYTQVEQPKENSKQVNDSLELDKIVVTASRKKESIKEVPSSVTIVNKRDIQN